MLVDFHAHILPGADHGSDSVETSLDQLKRAEAAGIGTIVATPHFYLQQHRTVESFLTKREASYNKLAHAYTGPIQIVKAAEVALSYDLATLDQLEKLCIGDTNYILLEMPGQNWTYWVLDSIYKITSQKGLRPVIAHIDRYDPRMIAELTDLDVLFQLNASAMIPLISRRRYLGYLRSGLIHVIGSDVHSTKGHEYKDYVKAMKIMKRHRDTLTENSLTILRGENLL